MKSNSAPERLSSYFLFGVPLLLFPVAGSRALHVAVFDHTLGAVLFASVVSAVFVLAIRRPDSTGSPESLLSSVSLIAPFALFLLLWVGLGPPWEANAAENRMRYLVLMTAAVLVTTGLSLLARFLSRNGDEAFSMAGFAISLLSGACYLVWSAIETAVWTQRLRGETLTGGHDIILVLPDIVLFAACVLSYLSTLVFALSMGRVGVLSRRASWTYAAIATAATALLLVRGTAFPDPGASDTPWYLSPALVAGIPAVPWIIPYLFGVHLLKASADRSKTLNSGE